MDVSEARRHLAERGRRMIRDDLSIGTSGNLSIRVDEGIVITPSGVRYDEIEADGIPLVSMTGALLDGPQPSSELWMHLNVYATTRAGAVVHTHSPHATAVSMVVDELPALHYVIVQLGGPVKVVPYATFGSRELAERSAEALKGRSAALLQNHGAITYGSSLAKAYERAELLEWLSRVYLLARQAGEPRLLSVEQLDDVIATAKRLRAEAAAMQA
jgi:L-fuculose-phosphate aldolase